MSSKDTEAEAWAQLVCVTDVDTPPIPISKDFLHIGRNSDADVCHAGNKLVSGKHCHIERDKTGKVWLYDTSTNGTLLNLRTKLTKGECRELCHGDEFHLVHKKGSSDEDIGYMFQDMKKLEGETSSDMDADDTQDYEFDQTLSDPNATLADADINTASTPSQAKKRKASCDKASSSSSKKSKKNDQTTSSESTSPKSKDTDASDKETSKPGSSAAASSAMSTSATSDTAKKPPEEDAIAETLVCIICQELLHDCISLQPCMHSFCSGCYSEWMERSNECPSCRLKVERINKNHIVNNLVEAYLKLNPDKKRPEADIQSLEAKNKITRDMLYPANQVQGSLECSDSEEYSNSDGEEEEEEDAGVGVPPNPLLFGNFMQPHVFGFGGPMPRPAPTPVCRQCPNYNANVDPLGAVPQQDGAAAGDPDAKTFPAAPDYRCLVARRPGQVGANHVLCLCCYQSMPDRRREFNFRPDCAVPPQQCSLCYRSFCHAYWGCRRANCHGCIAKVKDLNFGKISLNFLILDNAHESEIFKNYLEAKGLSVKQVFADCLAKMVTRDYTCTDQGRIESQNGINTPLCYTCGLKNFKELAYLYRRDIPNDQLPQEVTARPNCHWGKNCRTQRTKPEHSRRFNHICEQTRIA